MLTVFIEQIEGSGLLVTFSVLTASNLSVTGLVLWLERKKLMRYKALRKSLSLPKVASPGSIEYMKQEIFWTTVRQFFVLVIGFMLI